MSDRPKLSPYCIACGREHTHAEMVEFIERKERRGMDPLDAPKGGFLCPMCAWRSMLEMADEVAEAEDVEDGLVIVYDEANGREICRVQVGPIMPRTCRPQDPACRAAIVHTAFREFCFWSRRRVRRTCNEGRRSWCKLAAVEPPPLPPKRRRRKPRRKPCGL
jgi:hypothetical protein